MKNTYKCSLWLMGALAALSLTAQEMLISGWEFSNFDAENPSNTLPATVSDQVVGDGEAKDGVTGMLYANGQFGSDTIDNSLGFSLYLLAPDSAFNNDIPTPTRPSPNDLNPSVPIDLVPGRLAVADGTFGVGGPANSFGKNIVFEIKAIDGNVFTETVQFTSAIGRQGSGSPTIELAYSFDGSSFMELAPFTITSADQQGPAFQFPDAVGESTLYLRMTLPSLGPSDLVFLDNLQFLGNVGEGSAVTTFWPDSPTNGDWRNTYLGYDDGVGVGWLLETNWPWVFSHGIGDGEWMYIDVAGGSRNMFWGYILDGEYWILAVGEIGWYYSTQVGSEGWYQFQ